MTISSGSSPDLIYALRRVSESAALAAFDWIGRGDLEAYKIGKEWRIRRDHLDRHIEDRRVSAQPAPTGGLWDPDTST